MGVGPELTTAVLDEAGWAVMWSHPCVGWVMPTPPAVRTARFHPRVGSLELPVAVDISRRGCGRPGLPEIYGTAASEIWNGADMALLEPF